MKQMYICLYVDNCTKRARVLPTMYSVLHVLLYASIYRPIPIKSVGFYIKLRNKFLLVYN